MDNEIGKFLYHGTKNPVGTLAGDIKAPTLNRPFFVTDNFKVLREYIEMFFCKSVWILECDPKELRERSWWLLDERCMDRLKSRLPAVGSWLLNIVKSEDHPLNTLFDCTNLMINSAMREFDKDTGLLRTDGMRRLNAEESTALAEALEELGLATKTNEGLKVDDVLKNLLKKIIIDSPDNWMKARRLVKSKILKTIEELGYKALMDNETTGQYIGGYEFGILDKSLVKKAWSVSVEPNEDKIKKIEDQMSRSRK